MHKPDLIAIIPARGGSVGLPGKNKRIIHGHPLIGWSILFAKAHPAFSRIIVTTNDSDISIISTNYGAEVPFMRSENLSTSTAKSSDVVLDVIDRCSLDYDSIFVLLEPTSPYRTSHDLNSLLSCFEDPTVNKVVSVTEAVSSAPPFCYHINSSSQKLLNRPFASFSDELRRQDIDKYFYLDGSFYSSRVSSFLQSPSFVSNDTSVIHTNFFSSFEIDTENDFLLLESILSSFNPTFDLVP